MKSPLFIYVLLIGFVLLAACGMFEPEIKTGSIAIQFQTQQTESLAKTAQSEENLDKVRCVVLRGEKTVHDKYYSKTDSSFHIEINKLPESSSYTVQLFGKNFFGCIVGRAEEDSINVVAGQVTTLQLGWTENLERGTVTDIDGNVYQTVKIGDQWWMAENLKVTHYRNGEAIPNVTDPADWYELDTTQIGAYCSYENDPANGEKFGLLYNWFAANHPGNIAPEGWHMPSDEEWMQLEMALGMSPGSAEQWGYRGTDEGAQLKSTGTLEDGTGLWIEPNEGANNETCFSAVPSGWRIYTGVFYYIDMGVTYWTNTEYGDRRAWSRTLDNKFANIFRSYGFKGRGFSVRCIMD